MADAEQVLAAIASLRDELLDRLGVLDVRVDALAKAAATKPAASPTTGSSGGGGGVAVFPNYGRSKGAPIFGASIEDLTYYANGARRSLGDPGKARWHDKERALLAAIEAEIARLSGTIMESPPPAEDGDIPF